MQINLSEPYLAKTLMSDECIVETGNIISQCNQYAQEALIYGLMIGVLIGASCAIIAVWWYRGREN